ncbi:DUF3053 domain-containing protein, partial [Bordetella pertussis]|uniref:DUF3053 domain-containing protein n=1 Tax=Bordetella pertussis TaxID=520 RepID=UPI0021CAED5E
MPALAVVLALAGCVNREPEERAAFIAYLEQVAAPQAGVVAAPPDPPTEIVARQDGWDRLAERLAAARTGLEQARA